MLKKLSNLLNCASDKSLSYIDLKSDFGDDTDYLLSNFFESLDEFAYAISIDHETYNYCDKCFAQLKYLEEEFREPRYFSTKEARLWKFKERKFVEKVSKLLSLEASPIKLEYDTDGYYLGTLNLDKKYAIFFCYNTHNFEISSLPYITEKHEPILLHTNFDMLKNALQKFISSKNGLIFNVCELISLSKERGVFGGDIKKLLQFRGTRQKEIFNLADLKHNIANPTWENLTITIIDRHKINLRIGTYSKTFEYSDVPYFRNQRRGNEPKACWFTLLAFKNKSLPYTAELKNRLVDLRKFFANFGIAGDPFVIEKDIDLHGKKNLRQSKKSYVRRLFNVKLELDDYTPFRKQTPRKA